MPRDLLLIILGVAICYAYFFWRDYRNKKEIKRLTKVDDKSEQRIATLEKVLASHAKCIGEMREDKNE